MAKTPPLVFEQITDERNSLFLCLIEYKRVRYLTIVENVHDDEIQVFALDQLEAESIDQDWFMEIARRWYYGASDRYPLSFEFAKIGQGDKVARICKTFNMNSISRVIGKLFTFPVNERPKVKKRKAVFVPQVAEIKFKRTDDSHLDK